MKTIFKLCACLLAICLMNACTKDENKVYLQGGTAPVLTTTTGSSISYDNRDLAAVTLSWTNPDYMFNTGISSLDVTYNIEIDTAADFSNPAKKVIAVSKDLSYTMTVSELNDVMLNALQLAVGKPHTLVMRVISNMVNNTGKLTSNTTQLTATPYAIPPKVPVPTTGELYLVGSATDGGWNNPVPVPSQQFTKVSETMYEITVPLIGGNEYLFLPKNGDWSHKYAVKNKTVEGLSAGGDFGYDLNDNFPGPSASGNYKITVDFQRGVFTVKQI